MSLKKDITENTPLPVELNPEQLQAYSQGWRRIANKSGGALTKGQDVIADTTAITVVAAAVAAVGAATIADDLSAEIGAFRLVATNSVAAFKVGTVTVVGKDENGGAMTEAFAVTTDASGEWFSDSLWSEITSITLTDLNGTNPTAEIAITAIAVDAVKLPAATTDLTTVVGIIVSDSIADEAYGYMATKPGSVVLASLDRADQTPGTLLGTSGAVAGNLAALGTPAVGGVVARLLDVNKAEEASTTLLRVQLLLA